MKFVQNLKNIFFKYNSLYLSYSAFNVYLKLSGRRKSYALAEVHNLCDVGHYWNLRRNFQIPYERFVKIPSVASLTEIREVSHGRWQKKLKKKNLIIKIDASYTLVWFWPIKRGRVWSIKKKIPRLDLMLFFFSFLSTQLNRALVAFLFYLYIARCDRRQRHFYTVWWDSFWWF